MKIKRGDAREAPFWVPVCIVSHSVESDTATPWTVALQAPWSIGFSRARILEWVAVSFFRGSSQLRNQTPVSCIAGKFFTTERRGKCLLLILTKCPMVLMWVIIVMIVAQWFWRFNCFVLKYKLQVELLFCTLNQTEHWHPQSCFGYCFVVFVVLNFLFWGCNSMIYSFMLFTHFWPSFCHVCCILFFQLFLYMHTHTHPYYLFIYPKSLEQTTHIPLVLHYVIPKKKDILLCNHSTVSKFRTFNTLI